MAIERGQYRFTVKEYASGPFLAVEPAGDRLKGLGGDLGFDFQPGTTYSEAKEIATLLNRHVVSITLTGAE